MKINTLTVENFRNHKQTHLKLDKINFFVGHNNAGKSSLLAATEWGLMGKCVWTDKGGRGAAELVRQGAKQAAVAIEVEGLGGIVRTMPPHTLHVGKVMNTVEGQAAILNHLSTDEDKLHLALSAGAFLSLTQAEQRNFLFNAYGLSFTAELVANRLATWLKDRGQPEDRAEALANKARHYYPANITGGPEVLDVMEKRAKELRRDLKRDKQQLEAALAEMVEPIGETRLPGQINDIKVHLSQLRSQRDEYLRLKGNTAARQQALKPQLDSLEAKLKDNQDKVLELSERTKEYGTIVSTESDDRTEQQENDLIDRLNYLNDQSSALKSRAEGLNNRLSTLGEACSALGSRNRRCPLAPEHIDCAMSSQQVEELLDQLKSEYQLAKDELTGVKANLRRVQEELNLTSGELQRLRAKQQQDQEKSRQVMALRNQLHTLQAMVKQLMTDRDNLAKELAEVPQEQGNSTELAKEIRVLDQQIAKAEEQLIKAGELSALAKRREEMKQNLATLTTEVEDMEVLVKALGPEGVRKNMLASLLDSFQSRVNDRLNRLTEGGYQLSLGENMELLCRTNGGPMLPLKLLSKSEQLRVGIAVQEALSHAVGLSFLAIDEADMLDQENRDLLTGMLLDLAEEYDQVLVFTTVGEVPPQNPSIEGVKLFWVEEGNVSEI
ncbi:AAA family ATPase [Desulforamulus aquiferis]|uniref:Nuclease SbcCD subunit C n=1 Tax=Desulforamulus aquiferis TaxID=1397668 RepID=A0AAW7ZHF0_9FIRM|nr:AAA family ATPase [Desulforamulus aquiferis]MDO7788808.1 AAA family ATPase [Desulforamulus aquiferis]